MSFSNEVEAFIKDFTKDIDAGNAAVFAGAGMSKGSGYVDWPELLRDIASEIGLNVDREHDLIGTGRNGLGGNPGHSRIEDDMARRHGSRKVCVATICAVPCDVTGTTLSGASASRENSSCVMRSSPVT